MCVLWRCRSWNKAFGIEASRLQPTFGSVLSARLCRGCQCPQNRPKRSIYAQITGLSWTLLAFSRVNFFKPFDSYIYPDDSFSFNDVRRINVCGISEKWEHLIYFIGEFRVKLRSDFLLVFAQYFVLLFFLLITGLCFCMVQTDTKMICINYRFSCFPPLTCTGVKAWVFSSFLSWYINLWGLLPVNIGCLLMVWVQMSFIPSSDTHWWRWNPESF